jgi:transglutaminase-like putative cysteine protease
MRVRPALPLAGVAALFWGVAIGHVLAGAALAFLVEGVRGVRARWVFERREFERVADLASIALVALFGWQWFGSRHAGEGILATLLWLPAVLAPLVVMQRLGIGNTVPLTAFFWSLRGAGATPAAHARVDLEPAFVWLCLLSGACANARVPTLAAVGAALAGWLLWRQRGPSARGRRFAPVFAVALALAWLLQAGMVELQARVEATVMEALRDRLAGRRDGSRSQTAIGELGRLKLSGRVVARVRGDGPPPRLRDGAFETFAHDTWFARQNTFRAVAPEGDANWRIAPGEPTSAWAVSLWLESGRGVLPLPAGAVRLDGLNVGRVEASTAGTVRVQQGPALASFTARLASEFREDSPPEAGDLVVPAGLAPALDAVIAEAALAKRSPRGQSAALVDFFSSGFAYTTQLETADGRRRTLSEFLSSDRRGHCEYFASAATLLLRRLGVPARYATGYAVHEWSDLEQAWVARARDGHAWAVAWIDGAWRDVDVTPAGWMELEAEDASWWESVTDPFAWLRYRIALWRQGGAEEESAVSPLWLLLIVPLAGWVVLGVVRRSRRTDSVAGEAAMPSPEPEISALETMLRGLGFVRAPAASLHAWLPTLPWTDQDDRSLAVRVARGYRRLRFDPRIPTETERTALVDDTRVLRARVAHGALVRHPVIRAAGHEDAGGARL